MECLSENAILDRIEGRCPPEEASRADEHVASCGDCRALLEALVDAHDGDRSEAGSEWIRGLGLDGAPPGPGGSGATELASGTRIHPDYELGELLGEGGMGIVWAATHLPSGEAV